MKRTVILVACVVLIIAMAATCCAYTVTDYNMNSSNYTTVKNGSGFFMLSWSGNSLSVQRVAPSPAGADLTLPSGVTAASVFGGSVVALCADSANSQTLVCTYDIDRDRLSTYPVNESAPFTEPGFYYDSGFLYLVDMSRPSVINCYSSGGNLASSFTFPGDVNYIFSGYNGGLYVIASGALYEYNGSGYTQIASGFFDRPGFISPDIIGDSSGSCYELPSGRRMFTVEGYNAFTGCVIDSFCYYPSGNTVIKYSLKGEKTAYFKANTPITDLYAYGSQIYAAGASPRALALSPSEFTPYPTQAPDNGADTGGRDDSEAARPADSKAALCISSDVYAVDYTNYRICGVSSPTTFAQFKRNMRFEGFKASLYRGGKLITSGNVGTAMTVVFSNDNASYTFELSVVGDLTGEGNVNSRDLHELMDYMIGALSFNGVYLSAADLDGNNIIDVRDMALLARRTK